MKNVSNDTPAVRRSVLYIRAYHEFVGCVKATLLLSQLEYWQTTMDGWFFKTQADLQAETGLSRNELDTARKKLVKLGLIYTKVCGIPATMHYYVHWPDIRDKWCAVTGLPENKHPRYKRWFSEKKKGKLKLKLPSPMMMMYQATLTS